MKISGTILSNICRNFQYEIGEDRLVLFGIRGSLPSAVLSGNPEVCAEPNNEHQIKSSRLNYSTSRCTVGIWNRETDQVSLFPGSTVPSVKYLFDNQQALRHFNMLNPGKYELARGLHPREESGFQRHKAFLMNDFGHVCIPSVKITKRRLRFNFDIQEEKILLPGDNLHAGRMEPRGNFNNIEQKCLAALHMPFSSSGCITVVGQSTEYLSRPPNNGEWNSWARFMDTIDKSEPDAASRYIFLLFSYNDFNSRAQGLSSPETRYGASGQYIQKAQRILSSVTTYNNTTPYYSGEMDGRFERETINSLINFQKDFYAPKQLTKPDLLRFFEHTRHFVLQH